MSTKFDIFILFLNGILPKGMAIIRITLLDFLFREEKGLSSSIVMVMKQELFLVEMMIS